MTALSRVASSVFFAIGIALVLIGLSAALGFSIAGVVASAAAVASLLYAGGVWFGDKSGRLAPTVLVFDRELCITGGPHAGRPVASKFPSSIRDEIERRCAAAIAGRHSRFTVTDGGRQRTFDAAPVLSGHAYEIAGVLVEGAAAIDDPLPADAAVGVI
jgi:hypothetical protein